ncbi:DUF3871 family protein [Algoriphagus formosus]|uniref:DUF3871 family protein n=1 Tax=Algoriphagus formosus TaxID=2007308 RepID=UPI003F6F0BF5
MNSNFNPFEENGGISQSNGVSLNLPAIRKTEKQDSYPVKPFIEANTVEVSHHHLSNDCIIPVFAKDNERTISHQEFIEAAVEACYATLPGIQIELPEIRVSHQIKGRVPEAIHKSAKDLLDHEKTIYYERMAFIARIPSITEDINGNPLALTIGGVRSYNLENLYSKKSYEKFKFFIGFQNKVCCNLCVSTDGFVEDLRVGNQNELFTAVSRIISEYSAEEQLRKMKALGNYSLTESQFALLIGRSRLYNFLPKEKKKEIPSLQFTDGQVNLIAKDYYHDGSFSREEMGEINLWKVYNLFTQANKSSYIDTFLDRNLNALEFTCGVQDALANKESEYHWFIS